MNNDYSTRARAINLRTYLRELPNGKLESEQAGNFRSTYLHHKQLAEQANKPISVDELDELTSLGERRLSWVSGRTRWLGGTKYAQSRAACNFNCCFTEVATVYDIVDVAWLLLNGCGVGFRPQVGTLHGYQRHLKYQVIDTTRGPNDKGKEENETSLVDGTWTIRVGDSAKAWAKAIAKLFLPPTGTQRIVIDGSGIRGPGARLSGYGWICNGFGPLANAMKAIVDILNNKVGELLDDIDILDVVNHIGTVLSSRRSAQICLMDSTNPRVAEFTSAKVEYWNGNNQRRQSNNTLQFWNKPTQKEILDLLHFVDKSGGDPGIQNAYAAWMKAPWFRGTNPCTEILLPNKGFCNVVTNCLPRFKRNFSLLERAIWLIARANYRQTAVNLDDGILSPAWDQTNAALRLCGVSLTGITQCDWLTDYQIRKLRSVAICGAYSQADEWDMPRPKAVTTIKPEGTASKVFGSDVLGEVCEGIHKPLGRYIFNWINFSNYDPLVSLAQDAGYKIMPNPSDPHNVLVCFPIEYKGVNLSSIDGKEVNLEPAVVQLRRYLRWCNLWADHTVSCTIYYSPEELPAIADLLYRHWDDGFISAAFLRRSDPTKTAKDLGHPYLPQEVVTQEAYYSYMQTLRSVDWGRVQGGYEIQEQECTTGACPIK